MFTRKAILVLVLVLTVLLSGCGTDPVVTPAETTGITPTEPVVTTVPDATEPEPTVPPTTDASGKDLVTGLYPENHPNFLRQASTASFCIIPLRTRRSIPARWWMRPAP